MSIGKSSITKRVAKVAEPEAAKEKNIAPELVATVAAAPATPAPVVEPEKTPSKATKAISTSKSTQSSASKPATKKAAPKKPAAEKPANASEKKTEKKVDTAVIANISPETVATVIGHEEKSGFEKVQLGEDMPVHLL